MAFDLQRTDSLLGSRGSPERIAPVTQWDSAFFVHCTDSDRVLFLAIVTAPEIPGIAFARLGVFHLVHVLRLAMHTAGHTVPALCLQEFNGGKLVVADQRHLRNRCAFIQVALGCYLHGGNVILSARQCQCLILLFFFGLRRINSNSKIPST